MYREIDTSIYNFRLLYVTNTKETRAESFARSLHHIFIYGMSMRDVVRHIRFCIYVDKTRDDTND